MEQDHTNDETAEQPINPDLPKWYTNILERAARLPKQDLEVFPPDFTENLDHYLYGMPKKSHGAPGNTMPPPERNAAMQELHEQHEPKVSENNRKLSGEEQSAPVDVSALPNFARNILKIAETIPQEALDEFPSDYSENLDHYLYGMPKKSP